MATVARIADALLDDILHGRLAGGDRLDETGLAKRFETSRTPVREALNQLLSQGLLSRRGRGLCVTHYQREELGEIFEAMNEMEALAARLAAMRMPLTLRSEMIAHQADCRKACDTEDLDLFLNANEAFHFAIYAGTRNRHIEAMATSFRRRTAPARISKYRSLDDMRRATDEHDKLVEFILGSNPGDAEEVMRHHVSRTHLDILQTR